MSNACFHRHKPADILPTFPWDQLSSATRLAQQHPDGCITLSVGSPVDPIPEIIAHAAQSVLDYPQYPQVVGFPGLRDAISGALARRYNIGFGVNCTIEPLPIDAIMPVIGTKEYIASLVRDLGMNNTDTIIIPELAYPTYEVSALLAHAPFIRADRENFPLSQSVSLIFINSPSNPTGRVLSLSELRDIVHYARSVGAIVVSDECYLGLCWDQQAYSILDPRVHDGNISGLLAVHSTSKTSNMASYRSGYVAGDPDIISSQISLRRHTGMMMPYAVQYATYAAMNDDHHIGEQSRKYAYRRNILKSAIEKLGFHCDYSHAGLYLWATRGSDCMDEVQFFAENGIIVAPGKFYGNAGNHHIRIAFTASDEDIHTVNKRLTSISQ